MRTVFLATVLFALLGASPGTATWHDTLESARGRGKPIFLLQMFGRLDEQWC